MSWFLWVWFNSNLEMVSYDNNVCNLKGDEVMERLIIDTLEDDILELEVHYSWCLGFFGCGSKKE